MRTDIIDWITLSRIPGIGSIRFQCLLDEFQSPGNVMMVPIQELIHTRGIDQKTAQSIIQNRDQAREYALRDIDLIQENYFDVVTCQDEDYPENLKNIQYHPVLLYIKGTLKNQDKLSISIVGSRKASTYGILSAGKFSRELAFQGITIISGMARGIDGAAHRGALDSGGRTIAVLGNGIDICYPREHQELMEQIAQQGAVISEFPLGTPSEGKNFPIRNRIISGLALGTLIVEAADKSGALITADYALEQGREVFAVPGNISADTSKGSNRLIKQGAKLVETVEDILTELMPMEQIKKNESSSVESLPAMEFSEPEMKILKVLSTQPLHIDSISESTGLSVLELPGFLLNLELLGQITQLSGKRFVKSL